MKDKARDGVKLEEFDRNEWYDVYRIFKPNATPEQFNADWAEFQQYKAEHLRKHELQ